MIDLTLPVLLGASVCVFVGAVIRGFTGFGFGIAATPLLVLLFPPAEIVPPIMILQVLAGIQIYLRTRGHVDWRLLIPSLIGAHAGKPPVPLAGAEPSRIAGPLHSHPPESIGDDFVARALLEQPPSETGSLEQLLAR